MYRHKDVPRYDRIQGYEFLSDWYLMAWDILVDEVGMDKAEQALRPYYQMASKAVVLNLKEWGVIDEGLEAMQQTMAFAGQHTSSGRYELRRAGDIGFLSKGSCLAAYCRHRICHMRCDESMNEMCALLLPTHRIRLLGTIYDGNPTCLFMIAPKDSKVTPQEMARLDKTVLEPVPISEAFREKLVSNYLYETWLIMVKALQDSVGLENAERLLASAMGRLGKEYVAELTEEARTLGQGGSSSALACLVFTRLNSEAKASLDGASVEIASCPFLGQDRSICRLAHAFVSGLTGSEAVLDIQDPGKSALEEGPCLIRIR
jgi:hypothetical protein